MWRGRQERGSREALTCGHGSAEEDRVGHEDEQHGRVRGDVVGDGVLQALLTAAQRTQERDNVTDEAGAGLGGGGGWFH